jgi:hypothetical protein
LDDDIVGHRGQALGECEGCGTRNRRSPQCSGLWHDFLLSFPDAAACIGYSQAILATSAAQPEAGESRGGLWRRMAPVGFTCILVHEARECDKDSAKSSF